MKKITLLPDTLDSLFSKLFLVIDYSSRKRVDDDGFCSAFEVEWKTLNLSILAMKSKEGKSLCGIIEVGGPAIQDENFIAEGECETLLDASHGLS